MRAAIKGTLAFMFSSRRSLLIVILGVLPASILLARSSSSEPATHLETNFSLAGPRAVEELTQHSVSRDYGHAWVNLAEALSFNDPVLLNAYFAGPAKAALEGAIESQKRTGIRTHYLTPTHKVVAVFYAPEGDVMELHDTAELELRLTADGKVIHQEHVVLRYVVLMTPAADRWMVRQLQAVPHF